MRTVVISLAGLIVLTAVSARATPVAETQGTEAELGVRRLLPGGGGCQTARGILPHAGKALRLE